MQIPRETLDEMEEYTNAAELGDVRKENVIRMFLKLIIENISTKGLVTMMRNFIRVQRDNPN